MAVFRFSVGVNVFSSLFFFSSAVPLKFSRYCNDGVCKVAFQFSSDFDTSKQLCEEMNGQLITVQSKSVSDYVGQLLLDLPGEYWIGLRLPHGRCTNDTMPLKGYTWTTGYESTEFANWKNVETLCAPAPRCVSISVDQKWNEKLCEDQIDGFLCENIPEDDCCDFDPTYSVEYPDPDQCLLGHCEHNCKETTNGYKCFCNAGHVINRKNQKLCVPNCSTSCLARCDRNDKEDCGCRDGYILDRAEYTCVDDNECDLDPCDHYCFNTLGSYECSCRDGFSLVGEGKCVKIVPSLNPTTVHAAEVSPGSVIGVTVVILVAIVALMCGVYYYKQRKGETSIIL